MALRAATIAGARVALRAATAGKLVAGTAGLLPSIASRRLTTESNGATSESMPPSYELQLGEVVKQLADMRAMSLADRKAAIDSLVRPALERLGRAYVKDELGASSDIKYDEKLLRSVLGEENFNDMLDGGASEYVLRKHVRSVMRAYLSSVNAAGKIKIKNKSAFKIQMERLGLNVEFETNAMNGEGPLRAVIALCGFAVLLAGMMGGGGLYLAGKQTGAF